MDPTAFRTAEAALDSAAVNVLWALDQGYPVTTVTGEAWFIADYRAALARLRAESAGDFCNRFDAEVPDASR